LHLLLLLLPAAAVPLCRWLVLPFSYYFLCVFTLFFSAFSSIREITK